MSLASQTRRGVQAGRPWLADLGFRAFQLAWVAALAIGAVSIAFGGYCAYRQFEDAVKPLNAIGVRATPGENGPPRMLEPWSREGGLATIRRGDVVVAVDGRPVRADGDRYVLAGAVKAAPGPLITLTTRSADGAVRDHVIARTPRHVAAGHAGSGFSERSALSVWMIFRTLTDITALIAGIVLFSRRPRDPVAGLLSISCLLMASTFIGFTSPYAPALQGLTALIYPIGNGGLFLAILLFPSGRLAPRWAWLAAAAIVPWAMADAVWHLTHAFSYAWVNIPGIVIFLAAVVSLIVRYRRLPAGPQRQQIRWAMFGFAAAAVPALLAGLIDNFWLTDATAPRAAVGLRIASVALYLAATVLVTGGLLISLLRYRLYDADMVISRSAAYAIMTFGLAAVWAGAQGALVALFKGTLGHGASATTAAIAAALAALLITPAHHRMRGWMEHVFQRGLTDLRDDLPAAVADLRETASLERLLRVVLDRIGPAVSASRVAVVLKSGGGFRAAACRDVEPRAVTAWLRTEGLTTGRDDPLFPLKLPLAVTQAGPPETIGWLLLGPRPDGSFYGKDELEALGEIAAPVARAVHVVRRREARETARSRELAAIRRELAALRDGLDGGRLAR